MSNSNAEDCAELAARARELAADPRNEGHATSLREIAQEWERLATRES